MTALALEDRYFHAISHFDWFLTLFGIHLHPPQSTRWKRWITRAWTTLWLVFSLQNGLFLFFQRGLPSLQLSLSTTVSSSRQTDAFNGFILATSPLVFCCLIHVNLVAVGERTLRLVLQNLSVVDSQLGHPDFTSNVRPYSFAAIAWIATRAVVHLVCSVIWRLRQHDGWWLYTVQEWISLMAGTFMLLAVWLYVLCLQLILTYYKQLSAYLEGLKEPRFDEIVQTVRRMEHLQQTTKIVHQRFGLMLMANCCSAFVNMINSSYYLVVYAKSGDLLIFVWDSFNALEVFCRLLLYCQWADRIRSAATEMAFLLRKLRDLCTSVMEPVERANVTLFILELSGKGEAMPVLLGILPLSKGLVFQAVETACAFVVILYQFRIMEEHKDIP